MRLPWLQVDADGLTRSRLLGRLLGVHEHHGVGLVLALWAWALEMSPEGDFSGDVPGDAELVAAALSWPIGDASRLMTQLQRVGLIAQVPTLRVRGLSRYRRAWEKNQRNRFSELNQPESRGRVPGAGASRAGKVPGAGANPARETETETDITTIAAPSSPRAAKKPRALKAEAPPDPRHAPLVAELVEVFAENSGGAKYPFVGRDAKTVTALLAIEPVPERISTVWRMALRATGYPTVRTLPELLKNWAHFVGPPSGSAVRAPEAPITYTEGRIHL